MTQAIGVAARLSGVTIETIRYYEREGVVPKAARSVSGRRVYDKDAITRLRFVKRCRELGFPLSEIRSLLDLYGDASGNCDEVRIIGANNLKLVQEKIADLRSMEAALKTLVVSCKSGGKDCPMLKDLFAD
ncbi:MerR family transcriptional regulator [Kiloniella laminariae]|uniref:MerR family transcriptional regulator n=1 Tax=Kiloniella laminariae TaxID=454162 RepID=UPI00036B15DA|nr:helix-turn-helix domain-containing protein [Kiloniella laminariae]